MISYGTKIILLPMTAQTGLEMRGILTSCIYENLALGLISEGAWRVLPTTKQRGTVRLDMGVIGQTCWMRLQHKTWGDSRKKRHATRPNWLQYITRTDAHKLKHVYQQTGKNTRNFNVFLEMYWNLKLACSQFTTLTHLEQCRTTSKRRG